MIEGRELNDPPTWQRVAQQRHVSAAAGPGAGGPHCGSRGDCRVSKAGPGRPNYSGGQISYAVKSTQTRSRVFGMLPEQLVSDVRGGSFRCSTTFCRTDNRIGSRPGRARSPRPSLEFRDHGLPASRVPAVVDEHQTGAIRGRHLLGQPVLDEDTNNLALYVLVLATQACASASVTALPYLSPDPCDTIRHPLQNQGRWNDGHIAA